MCFILRTHVLIAVAYCYYCSFWRVNLSNETLIQLNAIVRECPPIKYVLLVFKFAFLRF